MPTRPLPPCGWKGWPPCPERRGTRRAGQYMCDDHDDATRRASDATRRTQGSAYGRPHRTLFRKTVLDRDPVCTCTECTDHQRGTTVGRCVRPSTEADHYPRTRRQLVKAKLDPNDPTYGRGLCKVCHDRHSARSSGAHGYRRPTDG